MSKTPELLLPAGSRAALEAAIEGGADAVYFGGLGFNARRNAKNFGEEEMTEAISLAHTYGVKVYITQNTLVYDRELEDYLSAAAFALSAGADALIVADMGGAQALRRRFPNAELHASTQMSGHSLESAKRLAAMGFSRMVCARELSLDDLKILAKESPIEIEMFIHGALCVCHSGQCLFSSVVGGRSGNRGECAQPCRLPYGGKYPLSLKDLCLAQHITELLDLGVSSLKIEGRMKSPEYVRDVARIYRRLLDERRNATASEMAELAEIFSRGGFTDGYFTKNINKKMLGVRSDADKESSRALLPFRGIERKLPIEMRASFRADEPAALTLKRGEKEVTVTGDVPFMAQNAPLTRESVSKNLLKLGGTPFVAASLEITLDEGLMLPVSSLNALRRKAVEALAVKKEVTISDEPIQFAKNRSKKCRSAVFATPSQITPSAKAYFDRLYLPLDVFDGSVDGVMLPPVIMDTERAEVEKLVDEAKKKGAKYALLGNLGHISLASGLEMHGDLRLNITNRASAEATKHLGFEDVILSPELSLPQLRDIGGGVVVYGRLPLMILEKCLGNCEACAAGKLSLHDRKGVDFPVLRTWRHRSTVYNSLPTCLSDRMDEVRRAGLCHEHYIFSVETKREVDGVICAFKEKRPLAVPVRRLVKNN